MPVEEVPPTGVTECGSALGRAHDVREQHGSQDAVRFRSRAGAWEKLLDLSKHGLGVAHVGEIILPPEFDVLRRWDVPGQVAAVPHPDVTISAPVEDEGRHSKARKAVAHGGSA